MDAASEKDAVLQAHAQNQAITALLAANPACIANARFDRGELTLWIARDDIRAACRTVQQAGYNFLVDVTCVDWYPSEPRFQVTYHILSHRLKERLRLCVMVDSLDTEVASITPEWPSANFSSARSGIFSACALADTQPPPHHAARPMGRSSLTQGLPGGGLPLVDAATSSSHR